MSVSQRNRDHSSGGGEESSLKAGKRHTFIIPDMGQADGARDANVLMTPTQCECRKL